MTTPDQDREALIEIAGWIARNGDGVLTDLKSAHSARGNAASEWMREDDRDQRREFAHIVELAKSSLEDHD